MTTVTRNSAKFVLFFFMLLSSFVFLGGTECLAQEPPFKVELMVRHDPISHDIKYIRLTSMAERLVIQGCTFNKGNCRSSIEEEKTLNYADQLSIAAYCPNFLEFTVTTDQGSWSFDIN